MRPQSRMKEPPRDAYRGKSLHHFEIAGGRSPGKTETPKINQQRNSAGNRGEKNQGADCFERMLLRSSRPKYRPSAF